MRNLFRDVTVFFWMKATASKMYSHINLLEFMFVETWSAVTLGKLPG